MGWKRRRSRKEMFVADHSVSRSLQVGYELSKHAVSAGAHAHELDGDCRLATNCSHLGHGAKEPRVYFHQDFSRIAKVEGRGCLDAFDAASAQTQVAQAASEQSAVQGKTGDLCLAAARVARYAAAIGRSPEQLALRLLLHRCI